MGELLANQPISNSITWGLLRILISERDHQLTWLHFQTLSKFTCQLLDFTVLGVQHKHGLQIEISF